MISLIFLLPLAIIFVLATVRAVHVKKKYGITYANVKELSWPAKEILKQYRALPDDNRPYADIVNILKALDIKHGVKDITQHFTISGYDTSYKSWKCRCYYADKCEGEEYRTLHNSLTEISTAIAAQEHALQLAGIAHSLDAVEELTVRLREERELIENVTQELTNNG